jgi:hypothetical protein
MEFIVLVILLFAMFMVYTVNTRSKIDEIREKKEYVLLRDVTKMVQREILTAVKVENGYYRQFDLPQDLNGINYSIYITNTTIIATTELHEEYLAVPYVNGSLEKGTNIITKQNGIITIQ